MSPLRVYVFTQQYLHQTILKIHKLSKPKVSVTSGSIWYMPFNIKMQLFASVKFRGAQQWLGGPEHSLFLPVYPLPWIAEVQYLYILLLSGLLQHSTTWMMLVHKTKICMWMSRERQNWGHRERNRLPCYLIPQTITK